VVRVNVVWYFRPTCALEVSLYWIVNIINTRVFMENTSQWLVFSGSISIQLQRWKGAERPGCAYSGRQRLCSLSFISAIWSSTTTLLKKRHTVSRHWLFCPFSVLCFVYIYTCLFIFIALLAIYDLFFSVCTCMWSLCIQTI